MERRFIIISAFALLISLAACEEQMDISNPGGQKQLQQRSEGAGSSPYFPFALGKKWEYEGIIHESIDYPDSLGILDTSWTMKTRAISEVMRETQLTGGTPLQVWEVKTSNFTNDTLVTDDYYYAHVTKDSTYMYDELSDSEPMWVSPAEPKLGDQWMQVFQMSDSVADTIEYNVIADNVSANGYSPCLEIKITNLYMETFGEFDEYDYWAKGEGSVLTTLHQKMVNDFGEEGQMIIIVEDTIRLKKGLGVEE
jgi:hypothetical protein